MRITGRARRLRIYIGDSDQWHHQPLWRALLELLKREGLAGATVTRGVAGFGAHSRIHTAALLDLSTDLPVIVEVIDRPDRLDRVMPVLTSMVAEGLITEEEVMVRVYRQRLMRPLSASVPVSDLMSHEAVAVTPHTPLAEVIARLQGHPFRALPVIDDAGQVLGIITNDDLVQRGGLPARLSLLSQSDAIPTRLAQDVMTSPAVTVRADQPAVEALQLLVTRQLKRVPVIDAGGLLVGMLSRTDLLRAITDGLTTVAGDDEIHPSAGTHVADIMRRDPAAVLPTTAISEVLDQLLAEPTHRVLVVDDQSHLLGIISDADLLPHLEQQDRPTLLARLTGRAGAEHQVRLLPDKTASDVMNQQVVSVAPDEPLRTAIRQSLDSQRHVLPVVDEQGRLQGLISRAEMLAALAPPADRTE